MVGIEREVRNQGCLKFSFFSALLHKLGFGHLLLFLPPLHLCENDKGKEGSGFLAHDLYI